MNSLAVCILLAATAAPPSSGDDATLYCFTAPWCTYCHEMQPVLNRMHQDGYKLMMVDKDKHPEVAREMGVQGLPYFVLIRGGQPVAQAEGRTSYQRLAQMFEDAKLQNPASRGQSPAAQFPVAQGQTAAMPPRPADPAMGGPQRFSQPRSAPSAVQPASHAGPSPNSSQGQDIRRIAMEASVRLKVDDPDGHSFGSGTIVHRQGEDALVLTCAHIFRDSQGQGQIHVDLFPASGQETVMGQIITYDLERDVALVAIRTQAQIQPIPLASRHTEAEVGQTVFSIGCDQGGDRRLHDSRVNTVNRYLGPANVQVAGAPIDGRSGGGLFSEDGRVIGVCNAADTEENEGIYASIPPIYDLLDQAKLADLFPDRPAQAAPSQSLADNGPNPQGLDRSPTRPLTQPLTAGSADPGHRPQSALASQSEPRPAGGITPSDSPAASADGLSPVEREILEYLRAQNGNAEVKVVLSSRDNPSAKPAVFSLTDQPSPRFLEQINAHSASGGQGFSSTADAEHQNRPPGVILRGQNR